MSHRAQSTDTAGQQQATPTNGQTSLAFTAEPIALSPPGPTVTQDSFLPTPPPPSFIQGNSRDGQNASEPDTDSATNPVPDPWRTLPAPANASTAPTPAFLASGMRVQALYKFEPTTEEDLAIEKGDIITVVGRETDSALWNGQLNGRMGVIPSNYVEPVLEPSAGQSLPAPQQAILQSPPDSPPSALWGPTPGILSPPLPLRTPTPGSPPQVPIASAPSPYSYTAYTPGPFSASPGMMIQQAPIPSPYQAPISIPSPYVISPYSTSQSAPAQMWRQAQTPQSVSMYDPKTQLYSQSQTPRPMSYASSPQAYPGFQSQAWAGGRSYSAPSAPATPYYSTDISRSTPPATAVSGRTTARRSTRSFVANDPFRLRSKNQTHKMNGLTSDESDFDKIEVPGIAAASNSAWTSATLQYGSGSQSHNAMKPLQNMTPSLYNAMPSSNQGLQSYPTAPPTSTQSPVPYNLGSGLCPSYGDHPTMGSAAQSQGQSQYSESQPTMGLQTPYPTSSSYPMYEVPAQRLSEASPPSLPSQLPYGFRPPSSDSPDKVSPTKLPTPLPQHMAVAPPPSDRPYNSHQPHYSGDFPAIENRRSAWSSVKRFLRHPFSFSRRHEDMLGQETEKVASEDGYSKVAANFIVGTLPSQLYLHILLRMPSLYFSRVARIFEEADLTLSELKEMALELDDHYCEATNVPPQYVKLKLTWENFIDSVMREWKTFNIISVLLLSAILTILQIDAAAADPVSRYAALFSLTCALMSLLFGCMYIIRFGSMRNTYRAAEWALASEARRTKSIWWNVWILLAMPVIWLTWSIILYIICIMSFIWRTGSPSAPPPAPLSDQGLLTVRVIITIVLGVGFIYGALIISTFRHYGEEMDKAWKQRIESCLTEMAPTNLMPMYNPHWLSNYQTSHTPFTEHLGADPRGKQASSPSSLDLQWCNGYQPQPLTQPFIPPMSSSSYADLSYTSDTEGKSSSTGNTTSPPYTPYAPYYQNLAEPQTQTRPKTPDSADSTVNLTRGNTFQNAMSHLDRTPSTSSGHSPIDNDPGYPTDHPLPSQPKVTATSNDVPPPPRFITRPAQPLPPSLPGSAYGGEAGEDADLQSVHVRFRSPLVSAQGSNSPWGSFSGASLRSERSDDNLDPTKPVNSSHAGRSKRPDNASYESLELKKGDPASPS